jgi:hypothetical protein
MPHVVIIWIVGAVLVGGLVALLFMRQWAFACLALLGACALGVAVFGALASTECDRSDCDAAFVYWTFGAGAAGSLVAYAGATYRWTRRRRGTAGSPVLRRPWWF